MCTMPGNYSSSRSALITSLIRKKNHCPKSTLSSRNRKLKRIWISYLARHADHQLAHISPIVFTCLLVLPCLMLYSANPHGKNTESQYTWYHKSSKVRQYRYICSNIVMDWPWESTNFSMQ